MDRRWPFDGRVLIIDDDPEFRASIRRELAQAGCPSRAADSPDLAINWLKKDLQLKVVLLDQAATNGQTDGFVRSIHLLRTDVTIVASSLRDVRSDFAAMGVDRFLRKPWELSDLIDVLSQPDSPDATAKQPASAESLEAESLPCTETRIGKADSDTALLQVSCGQRVRIAVGSMTGWTGTVVAQRSGGRILVQLEGGIFLEVHQFCVEILRPSV